jgi:acyl dehydratase
MEEEKSKIIINSFEEFSQYMGKDLGKSEYLKVTQSQINQFADATLDHQWIHLDVNRAKKESPFKNTIAHGYLTISLIPHLFTQIIGFRNVSMLVNYGIDRFKFGSPVVVNKMIRLKAHLIDLKDFRGITKAQIKGTLEIKDQKKPAFSGIFTFLYHFTK